jgi:hypothetical protein
VLDALDFLMMSEGHLDYIEQENKACDYIEGCKEHSIASFEVVGHRLAWAAERLCDVF